ncbi:MAG: hypothetical protein RLO50_01830 [Azospirillaceae bacterium]
MRLFRRTVLALAAAGGLAGLGACELVGGQTPLISLAGLERDSRSPDGSGFLATLDFGNRTGYAVLIERVELLVEEPGQGDAGGPDLAEGAIDLQEFWIVAYDVEQVTVPVTARPGIDVGAILDAATLEPPGVVLRGRVWVNHDPRPVPFGPLPR